MATDNLPKQDEREYGAQVQEERDADALAAAAQVGQPPMPEVLAEAEAQSEPQPAPAGAEAGQPAPATGPVQPTNLMQRIPHNYEPVQTGRKATTDRISDYGLLWQALAADPNVHPTVRQFAQRMNRG